MDDVKPRNRFDALIQLFIPPALVLLLVMSIIELFYDVEKYYFLIDIFDLLIIVIFACDLYFRWQDNPQFVPFLKKHYLDIIATIPFNLIFLSVDYLIFTRGLRGVRLISRFARYAKLFRFTRFLARAPRFFRLRHKFDNKVKHKKYQPHEKEFEGTLSFKVILLVTINSIMGTGIWFLTSAGAKHAGPASLISWAILSLIAVYISMCFSELTAMFPRAGGVYEFAKQAYGRFWSFVIGWTTSISGSVTISMLLLGALQYMIPIKYSHFYVPIAIFLVVIFNFVAYRGMQTSTYMLVTFAIITIVTITSIIIPGFFSFDVNNFDPFFVFPTINVLLAIFFIAETFFGWESAIFLSAETKNPKKVMPRALIIGTIIIAGFALLLSFIAMGVIPWQEYAESVAPLRDLGHAYFGGIGAVLFTLLVSTSIIGAVASWIVTAPRLLMALAEDRLFFVQFAKIHPKHKSPYVSIVFQVFVISILVIIGAGSYETLLHLLIPLILILYSAVLFSVVILRVKRPDIERPFKVPFGRVGPVLIVFFMLFLLYMFVTQTHHAFDILRISISLILFGIPAYFTIELFYDQKYVKLRRNFLANISHYGHILPMPKLHYRRAINLLGPIENNHVIIDFDCGTGGFLRKLIKMNYSFKKIHAVSKLQEETKVLKEKLSKKNKNKLEIHYTKGFNIPQKIKADRFFSYNTLGHINKIPLFLKQLNNTLKKKGKFCFYIKNNFINMTPNALLIDNREKLKKTFDKFGFDVHYNKKKGLFKEEIYIYGTKK